MKAKSNLNPPIAKQIHFQHKLHGDVREDPFFWLKDSEDPAVIDYLNQENEYYKDSTKHLVPLQENLFAEMKGRIKEDDNSVPYYYNGYWYITRYKKGT